MTPADIICTKCECPYSIPEGCELCEPAKKHISWPERAERTDIETVGWQSVRLIQKQQDDLERAHRMWKKKLPNQFSPQFARDAASLGRAMSQVLAEVRKAEDRERKRLRGMSYDQKAELFLKWVRELPQEHQEKLLRRAVKMLKAPDYEEAEIVSD